MGGSSELGPRPEVEAEVFLPEVDNIGTEGTDLGDELSMAYAQRDSLKSILEGAQETVKGLESQLKSTHKQANNVKGEILDAKDEKALNLLHEISPDPTDWFTDEAYRIYVSREYDRLTSDYNWKQKKLNQLITTRELIGQDVNKDNPKYLQINDSSRSWLGRVVSPIFVKPEDKDIAKKERRLGLGVISTGSIKISDNSIVSSSISGNRGGETGTESLDANLFEYSSRENRVLSAQEVIELDCLQITDRMLEKERRKIRDEAPNSTKQMLKIATARVALGLPAVTQDEREKIQRLFMNYSSGELLNIISIEFSLHGNLKK